MRPVALAALGAAAYAAFLVVLLPASFVAARLEQAPRGALRIEAATGSAWNGAGRATVATPAGPLAIEELRWRLRPSRLLSGRIAFDVRARSTGLEASGEVGRSPSAWEARELRMKGEASAAAAFLPLLAHWRPEGALSAAVPRLAWSGGGLRGEARLEWRGAAVALAEVRPLGSYRLDLRGEGGPADVSVSTLEGPLRIAGHGTFVPPSQVAFNGEARAEGPAAASLQALLDALGTRRPDGARTLEWRQR